MDNEFNLERAIAGEPLKTVGGETAEFIAYRPTATASSQVIMQVGTSVMAYYADGTRKSFSTNFDLRMKSQLKQIDWTKLPVDTLLITQAGYSRYFNGFIDGKVALYAEGRTFKSCRNYPITEYTPSDIQIAPDQPWTVWQGGEYPVPDGLEFEYMTHDCPGQVMVGKESASAYLYLWCSKLIYAYRLTGRVSGGWKL
jgi:hypothetical protein